MGKKQWPKASAIWLLPTLIRRIAAIVGLVAAVMAILGVQGLIPGMSSLLAPTVEDVLVAPADAGEKIVTGDAAPAVFADRLSINTSEKIEADLLLVANLIDLGGLTLSLPGRRVILIAREIRNGEIDVSGPMAPGLSGSSGKPGGEITIIGARLSELILRANGGVGLDGEDGSSGSPGRDGDCAGFGGYRGARPGEDGRPGGNGGDGGSGGRVRLATLADSMAQNIEANGGTAGSGGLGGPPGSGGRGCVGLGGSQSSQRSGNSGTVGSKGKAGSNGDIFPPKTLSLDEFSGLAVEINRLLEQEPLPNKEQLLCEVGALLAKHVFYDIGCNEPASLRKTS